MAKKNTWNRMKNLTSKVALCMITWLSFGNMAFAEGDGYGENPGGFGGDTVIVDNASDFKSYAGSATPYVILIKDTIDVGSEVRVRSFKTISGINSNSTVLGDINISSGTNNVVVKNLNISNPGNDGITIRNAQYILVDNCTVYDCADGCIDVTVESDFVTISNCRFYYEKVTFHKFVNLIGADDGNITDRGKLHVTMHGNWWDYGCTSRMPRVRFGYVHMYNNYNNALDNHYASRSGLEGSILSEYNYFEGVRLPLTTEGGWAKSVGNKYDNCIGTIHPGTDEVFTPSYAYSKVTPDEAKTSVMQNAGNSKEKPVVKWNKKETFIDWSDKGTIILGTPLTESHLNATATGNTSTPIYSSGLGTVLTEGYQTITVTFPEDENYRAASKTVNIRVKYDYYALNILTENGTGKELIQISPEGKIIDGKLSFPIDTEVELTATNNILSTFEHWSTGETNPTISVKIEDDTEITAIYQPLPYIVAWDLFNPDGANSDRAADFYFSPENENATLFLKNVNGSTTSWTAFSVVNTLNGKNAAMVRRGSSSAKDYFFEIQFNATHFANIKIDANMLGMNTYYTTQNVEYSIDGISFTKVGSFNLLKDTTWYNEVFQLPTDANKAENVIVRFTPDINSTLVTSGITGTSISEIRVLADDATDTPVKDIKADVQIVNKRYFTLEGKEVKRPVKGVNIILLKYEDGSTSAQKVWVKPGQEWMW